MGVHWGMADLTPKAAPYHHGRLREALVDAAIALVEEGGVGAVSVREAARRAGVSSGAPFRHFPSRAALITAAAEVALARLRATLDAAVAKAEPGDPLTTFGALMLALVRWTACNAALFEVLADRRGLDLEGAPGTEAGSRPPPGPGHRSARPGRRRGPPAIVRHV